MKVPNQDLEQVSPWNLECYVGLLVLCFYGVSRNLIKICQAYNLRFIVDFQQMSHIMLLLLTLTKYYTLL